MSTLTAEQTLLQLEQETAQLTDAIVRKERLARIEHLRGYAGDDRIVSTKELQDIIAAEPATHVIPSGLAPLDALIGGFTYEQLVVLSAQEKSGKTAFALDLVNRMAKENPTCFLFEQSPREIVRQLRDQGRPVPHFYTPLSNVESGWDWIVQRALESMVKHGSRIFVIDNFDWLEKNTKKRYNTTEEMCKDMLLTIKNFCKQYEVVVILIAHTVKMPVEQVPQANDIKGTAAFKQIADMVLLLWRVVTAEKVGTTKSKTYTKGNETLLNVAANRRTGREGFIKLIYDNGTYTADEFDTATAATTAGGFKDLRGVVRGVEEDF